MSGFPLAEDGPVHQAAVREARLLPSLDETPGAFREAWRRAAATGLFTCLIPDGAFDWATGVAMLEGFGEGCASPGFLLAIGAHCFGVGAPLARYGAPAHREILSDLRDGTVVAAFAASEANAGSDVMALQTSYRCAESGLRISGEKRFVTNAADADYFMVLATRDARQHFRGVSAFMVPRDTPGLSIRTERPVGDGLTGCSIGTLMLDDVLVSHDAMVGRAGAGARIFQHAMLWERTLMAATHLGRMRRQFDDALAFTRERRQFGRPISANQYVTGRVIDMLMRYRTARLLVYDAAAQLADGRLTPGHASLTKLYVSEAAAASSMDALRLQGGVGLMEPSAAARDLWSSLAGVVYSGTSELQRVILGAELGLVE